MIDLRSVEQVREAEESAMRLLPPGALMMRAAEALSLACVRLLVEERGAVAGLRVVLMVGGGNNGGDALWAGALLARRGARVDAMLLSERAHAEGCAALQRAGGSMHRWLSDDSALSALIGAADLVIDGILGIGGSGGLRPDAAELVDAVARAGCLVVATDLPSGVDADTGVVAGASVVADVTVTFGAVKPGLLLDPGRSRSGSVQLVDIGLTFEHEPPARVLEESDVAELVPEPSEADYKYSRGVAALAVGSPAYPGAALLAVAAARHANVGMVRQLDRGDGIAGLVVSQYPDVVMDGSPPAEQARATAWGCGSGFTGSEDDLPAVCAVLEAPTPVVLDAGALTVLAMDADVRAQVRARHDRGLTTVITPHAGEFDRLVPGLRARTPGRLQAAASAARELGCTVVLKGPGTVVAAPDGEAYVDAEGTQALAVAGTGDVLTGIITGLLATTWSAGRVGQLTGAVAAAVWLHGRAGRIAAEAGPVTAPDVAQGVRAAIRDARLASGGVSS